MIQDRLDRLDEADRVEATPHGDRIEHGSMHLASLPGACMKAGKDEYFHGSFLDSSRTRHRFGPPPASGRAPSPVLTDWPGALRPFVDE